MHENLTIEILQDGIRIGCIYYHSSGDSVEAFEWADRIAQLLKDDANADKEVLQRRLLRFNHENGGGIWWGDDFEDRWIQHYYGDENIPFEGKRDYGLIALSDYGMEHMLAWPDRLMKLDIATSLVECRVLHHFDDVAHINQFNEPWRFEPISEDDVKVLSINPDCYKTSQAKKLIDEIGKNGLYFRFDKQYFAFI